MSQTIAYCSPFVPPEWIAAHGLRPLHLLPSPLAKALPEGVCPFAGALAESAAYGDATHAVAPGEKFDITSPVDGVEVISAVILTTTCDQMRRAAGQIGQRGTIPVFLMNVPATWQTPTARAMYGDELHRLGRWMTALGGQSPEAQRLVQVMQRYDADRQAATNDRKLRDDAGTGIAVALVGGPLRPQDRWIFDCTQRGGGQIVLDATETGQRTMPAPFVEANLATDAFGELVRAYFDTIPDAFRRPDTLLHAYLKEELARHKIRGILLVRYLWCDLWHAQLGRLKESTGLPVVEIDLGGEDHTLERTRTRIEALLDIIQ